MGATAGTQLIATAFTFGTASLVFATLPFLFILARGLYKANSQSNAHSSSVVSVFTIGFVIHFLSCVGFMVAIKCLDVLNALNNPYLLQNKIFGIFWARSEDQVFSLSGASGSVEDKGAYLQLHLVQIVSDWLFICMPLLVFIVAITYGSIQAKKDVANFNLVSMLIWCIISIITSVFIFYLWAKIATFALFIPNGEDVVGKIIELYRQMLEI